MAERKARSRGDRKALHVAESLRQVYAAAILTDLYPRSQIDIYIEVSIGLPLTMTTHEAGGRVTNAVGTIVRKISVGTRACPI